MSKRAIVVTNSPRGIFPFTITQLVYEPIAIFVVAGAAYAMGTLMGAQWTMVPLAATIVTAAVLPASYEAQFGQAVTGNLMAMLTAFVVIRSFGLEHTIGADLIHDFGARRAIGVLIAIVATPIVCTLFRVLQPSAAATAAFIVFAGVTPAQGSALHLTVQIVIVTALGDILRRWRVKGGPAK